MICSEPFLAAKIATLCYCWVMVEAVTAFDKSAAFRVSEVGQLLGVTESTILAWIARGELPAARCGRTFLIPKTAIETMLALPPGWPATGGRYL